MSFNFGTPVPSTSNFSIVSPAGDAKTTKEEFSLLGSGLTTQSSAGLRTPSSTGIIPLDVSSAQSAPLLATSAFRKGSSIFSPNRAVTTGSPLFGAASATLATALGSPTIQAVPSCGSTEQLTLKSSSDTGLLGNTFQAFGTANSVAQPTPSSFNVAPSLSTFGSVAQGTATTSGQLPRPTFGTPQTTTQLSFENISFSKQQIATDTTTNTFAPTPSVPTFTTLKPTAPIFPLGSSNPIATNLPTVTPFSATAASVNTTTVPNEFTSGTSSVIPTITATQATTAVNVADGGHGATVSSTAVLPTIMTYGQLEDLINKWTLDLENQSKIFTNQAKQLNAWDRLLISNGDKILSLNNSIERVKQQQHQLDQEIDFIKAQQNELEHLIVPLETELQATPLTDTDRNHTYQLAENMDSQLKQMTDDIKEIIDALNESNKNQESSTPIIQIGRILNAHMNSLQWIDVNTNKISSHLDQLSKMHSLNRRNHEIVLQRTYD